MIRSPFTVDLYIYAAHEVAVWEPIWWRLRQRGVDAQIVVEPPGMNRARGSVPDPRNGWRDDKANGRIDDLMDQDMYETVCASLQRRGMGWLECARLDADAVLTTSGTGWFSAYQGLRIRAMYGVGAVVDSYGHGPVNNGMDLVLAHGPLSEQAIRSECPQTKVEMVGFPKWADERRTGRSKTEARAELGIADDGRPVVAWLPTWAHNSSLDRFAPALTDLSSDHLVVAKPHHNNLRFERTRLAAIDPSILVLDDLDTLVPLIIAADVVIGDVRSGGITEALLGDRPVVGLSADGPVDAQGLLAGIETAVVLCDEPQELRAALHSAMRPDRAVERRRWAEWCFGPAGGDDDARAADAIIRRIDEVRRSIDAGPRLIALDRWLADAADEDSPEFRASVVSEAWPTWSGDPRLHGLLAEVTAEAEIPVLEACSRFVRLTGDLNRCPLRARWSDASVDIDERLAVAAVAAVTFADEGAASAFIELASEADPIHYDRCLVAILSYEPSLLPAFTANAASTRDRRDQLAISLRDIGAERDEIDMLLAA